MNQSFGTIIYGYKENGTVTGQKAAQIMKDHLCRNGVLPNVVPQQLFFFQLQIAFPGEMSFFFNVSSMKTCILTHDSIHLGREKYVTKSVTSHKTGATTASHQQHQTARYPKVVQGIQTVEMIDALPQPTRILESIGGQG